MIVGLTGNTGAGKSTAAHWLAEWGARVVDADALGHRLLLAGSPVHREIVARYGGEILDEHGAIVRARLAPLVFATREETEAYNRIIHPALVGEIRRRVREEGEGPVVVDAALLFEWGLHREMDAVIVISAPEEMRRARVGDAAFAAREAAQWPEQEKTTRADQVVDNNGDLNSFKSKLENAWRNVRGTGKDGCQEQQQ